MNRVFVVKIGGNVIDDAAGLGNFLTDFSMIREPKILIHGGGGIATRLGEQLGIKPVMIKGRRVTDVQTLDLVTMVYGGLINKQITAKLQQLGVNAMGITGADGNMIRATKRPAGEVDFGFVGDLNDESVNSSLLYFLLKQNIMPVFAPLTHAEGQILNTNADTIASAVSVALSKHFDVRLVYCFEKRGVLEDVSKPDSVINTLTLPKYKQLLEAGALHDGILPKIEGAFEAIRSGVKEVVIGDAQDLKKNTGTETTGTLITLY
jgi:acetylglutamate kinase